MAFIPILSGSSWKCDFLRKTVIHSSCLSQDAKSSEHQIHQSLGKPNITPEHPGGDVVNETPDRPPPPHHVLSFFPVKFILQDWGGRQSKPGTQEGAVSGKAQVVMPLALCQSGSSLDKNISNRNPWDCLRLCADENKFKISCIKAKK